MRPIRIVLFAALSALLGSVVAYFAFVRPRVRAWGFDASEAALPIPGDDLIAEPSTTETRGITIDAPVHDVWPWLVQMGFNRGGWYSYDILDSKGTSADVILPEFQQLDAGEIMHIDPVGGFEVKVVEPHHALVLYTDTALARRLAEKAADEGSATGAKARDALGRASYPDFAASWAFVLQPAADGTTRLIERFRARTPGNGPANAVLGEIMGTGIVLMTRKQMIGIKERVERGVLGATTEPAADQDTAGEPVFAG